MAIIEGIQICIPAESRNAKQILTKMQALRQARFVHRVSRRQFLNKWSGLRKALFLTRDYQDLRQRILARTKGICETCHTRPYVHVHHVTPVAFNPLKALEDANCQGLCERCHKKAHRLGAA